MRTRVGTQSNTRPTRLPTYDLSRFLMIAAVNSEVVAEPAIARYDAHEDAMDGNQAIRP